MRRILGIVLMFAVLLAYNWSAAGMARQADTYKVVADSLNVRSEPSATSAIAGSLKYGEVVTALKEQQGWLQINSGRLSGWVAGYYLKRVTGSAGGTAGQTASGEQAAVIKAGGSRQATVLTDSLRMRTGPGTGYAVNGSLAQGDRLTVLDAEGDWTQVRTAGGQTGWVSSPYIGEAGETVIAAIADNAYSNGLRGKVIVVDPGHGGTDPGMLGTTYDSEEKDLTLSTALMLADELRARGARVIMTRTRDGQKPELSKRVEVSEANAADAFVSIHYNSSTKKTSGMLTFYYSKKKDEPLARAVETHLAKKGIGLKSNGVSFGDYHVLRENDRPAALVELGFLSNPKDEKIVTTETFQRKAAEAIADGLEDYFD